MADTDKDAMPRPTYGPVLREIGEGTWSLVGDVVRRQVGVRIANAIFSGG